MNKDTWIGSVALLVIVIAAFYFARPPMSQTVFNADIMSVQAFVSEFGSKFKNVSLLADTAPAQIATEYGPYVTPELLAAWQQDVTLAPGRSTSSPWPDRIQVAALTPMAQNTYLVEGTVIEVTSDSGTNPAATYPVRLQVEKRGDTLIISNFAKGDYSELPQEVTLVGYWECLPHTNPSQPHTLECAFGIAVDQSDAHYAVSTSAMSTYPVDFPTGTKVRVRGVLVPKNQLNSDAWQKYNIDGIVSATTIEAI